MNNFEDNFKKNTGLDFNKFYKIQYPKLIWFLNKWTKDNEASEDIANEAFMQCLKNIHMYNAEKSKIHTWLFKIAHNMTIKNWKDDQKIPTISMDKEVSNNAKLELFIPYNDSKIDINRNEINKKKYEYIKQYIYDMPEKHINYKTVLIMREIDSMSYDEISESLNLNLSTVKSQIRKGREIVEKNTKKTLDLITRVGIDDFQID